MSNYLFQDAKVYCGTYAKYNNGNLYGDWIRLDDQKDVEEFVERIKELHKDEDDPEFMFQDQENMHIDGEPCFSDIIEWYECFKYKDYDSNIGEELVMALVSEGHCKVSEIESFMKRLFMVGEDYEDIGAKLIGDEINLPSHLVRYFNFNQYGEDVANDFTEIRAEGKVYLFY